MVNSISILSQRSLHSMRQERSSFDEDQEISSKPWVNELWTQRFWRSASQIFGDHHYAVPLTFIERILSGRVVLLLRRSPLLTIFLSLTSTSWAAFSYLCFAADVLSQLKDSGNQQSITPYPNAPLARKRLGPVHLGEQPYLTNCLVYFRFLYRAPLHLERGPQDAFALSFLLNGGLLTGRRRRESSLKMPLVIGSQTRYIKTIKF